MFQFPIGVMYDSFNLPMKDAIVRAKEIGAAGFQIYSTYGEYCPEKMTEDRIHELNDMLKSNGLVVTALCGDLGHGFGNKDLNPELIEKSKRIVDLALKLNTNIVTTHIGVVPKDSNHERYKIMQEACSELAEYADSVNAHFAIETGPETSDVLKRFLDSLHSTGVAVNLDPANLVMDTEDDPVNAVYNLRDYIVHTHAKDGICLYRTDTEYIYGVRPLPTELQNIELSREVPLGTGSVDFNAYLKALEDIGYRGYLTIERECGDDPAGDIKIAADYLRKVMVAN